MRECAIWLLAAPLAPLALGCVFGSDVPAANPSETSSTDAAQGSSTSGPADSTGETSTGAAELTGGEMTSVSSGSDATSSSGDATSTSSSSDDNTSDPCAQADQEPNDMRRDAQGLDEHACAAAGAPVQLSGTVGDALDVDWYAGRFVWDCVPGEPTFAADVDIEAQVCVIAKCVVEGQFSTNCERGTALQSLPDGFAGCCGLGSAAMYINCLSGDESFDGWIAVEPAPGTEACTPYLLTYDSE